MVAVSVLLLACTQATAAETGKIVVRLKDEVRLISHKDPLSKLTATLEMLKVQRATLGGIKFTLDIVNKNNQAIKIRNPLAPLNLPSIYLRNKAGQVIELPLRYRGSVDPLRSPEAARRLKKLPFKVSQVLLNGQRLTKKAMESRSLQIAAGGHLRISVEIDKILKGWKRDYPAPVPPPPSKIPVGEYKLKVSVTLTQSLGSDTVVGLATGRLGVKLVAQ